MNKLKKVVIPVAGLGTRMLPATKSIPKEMLPIDGKPIIQHVVKEAIDAGFSEIILITREDKISLKSHFETNSELESILEKTSNKTLLKSIKEISMLETKIISVTQKEAKGLGHAILCARTLIAEEPFAVLLPDMVLDSDYKKNNLALMKKNYEKTGTSSLLLGKVKKSEVKNYGIAKLKKEGRMNIFFPLDDVIEKPSPNEAPSNLFIAGRYVFDNEILSLINKEKPDSSGEIQLTGAISNFLKSSKKLNGLLLEGNIHDCGNKLGYLIANIAFSLKDRNTKKEVLKYLKK